MPYFTSQAYRTADQTHRVAGASQDKLKKLQEDPGVKEEEYENTLSETKALYVSTHQLYIKAKENFEHEIKRKNPPLGEIAHAFCDNAWAQAYVLYQLLIFALEANSDSREAKSIERIALQIDKQVDIADKNIKIMGRIDKICVKKGTYESGETLADDYTEFMQAIKDCVYAPNILKKRIEYYRSNLSSSTTQDQEQLLILEERLADYYSLQADLKKDNPDQQKINIHKAIKQMDGLLQLYKNFKKAIPITLHLSQLRNFYELWSVTTDYRDRIRMVDHFKKYQLKTFIPESGKLTADEQELADYVKLLDTELNERDKQYSYQYLQSILKSTSSQPVTDLSINKQDKHTVKRKNEEKNNIPYEIHKKSKMWPSKPAKQVVELSQYVQNVIQNVHDHKLLLSNVFVFLGDYIAMQKHVPITNPLLNLADQYFSQAQIFSPKSASPLKAQAKLREKFHFFIESKAYSAILPQGNYESFLTARLVELEKLMPNGLQKNQFFEELTSILKNRVDGFLQHASAIERTGKQLKS